MPFSYLRVTIHAQGQARRRKTQRYSQINTASVSEPSAETERSETLGTSNSLVTAGTRARSGRKTAESQKPIHNFKEHRRPAPPASKSHSLKDTLYFGSSGAAVAKWWSRSGSNRRPSECHSDALPIELRPHFPRRVFPNTRGVGALI